MSDRRSFITGLVALVAAPAIVRAGSLMPVNSKLVPGNTYFEINRITREAVQLFKDSNAFIEEINAQWREDYAFMDGEQWDKVELERSSGDQYENMFAADGAKIGVLRTRLPSGTAINVTHRAWLNRQQVLEHWPDKQLRIPDSLAPVAAAVAVAPVMLAKPVTRRFWGK